MKKQIVKSDSSNKSINLIVHMNNENQRYLYDQIQHRNKECYPTIISYLAEAVKRMELYEMEDITVPILAKTDLDRIYDVVKTAIHDVEKENRIYKYMAP